jgi:uncharacterized protein YqjF (DUF2071 family)
MRQQWRDLLFLHWAVPPESMRPLVPRTLELDLFEGSAYVGLVAFTMRGVRPVLLPSVPWLSNFHETNVRTYVHLGGRDPGVWFFSLDAANPIAVSLARRFFYLPYHHARMFLEHEMGQDAEGTAAIVYAGTRRWPAPLPASYLIRGEVSGQVESARPGSIEHFLAERYILYSLRQDRLFQGRVHHTAYPLQPARVVSLDETLLEAAGIARPAVEPLAYFASGVDVDVFPLRGVRLNGS